MGDEPDLGRTVGHDPRDRVVTLLPVLPARPGVNQDLLHPIFRRRLAAFFAAHERLGYGKLSIYSGPRLYTEQKYLYDGWVARLPGFNPANNPDRQHGWLELLGAVFLWLGSLHTPQSTGFAYAVDLSGYGPRTHALAREFGIWFPINDEDWHAQPMPYVTTIYDDPTEVPFMALSDAEQTELLTTVRALNDAPQLRFVQRNRKGAVNVADGIWRFSIPTPAVKDRLADVWGIPSTVHQLDEVTFDRLTDARARLTLEQIEKALDDVGIGVDGREAVRVALTAGIEALD